MLSSLLMSSAHAGMSQTGVQVVPIETTTSHITEPNWVKVFSWADLSHTPQGKIPVFSG